MSDSPQPSSASQGQMPIPPDAWVAPAPGAPAAGPAATGHLQQPQQPYSNDQQTGPEHLGRGMLFALGGVVLGGTLTAIIWKFGIQWSFTSFVLAAASVALYKIGSGGALKRGVVPLVALILAGTIASFFACVAIDGYSYWSSEGLGGSPWAFIADNIFAPEVLSSYGREIAFFVLFAGLGMFTTLRGMLGRRG